MVFTRLSDTDKEAFFSLLDEYFTSRPDLLAGASAGSPANAQPHPGVAALSKAFAANPEATAGIVSAGLKHGVPKSSPYAAAAADPQFTNAVGRVAAAGLAHGAGQSPRATPPPPVLPRRTPSSASASASANAEAPPHPPPAAPRASGAQGLVTSRKMGNIDTSSTKSAIWSLGSRQPAPVAAPPIPSAFPKRTNTFQPPPARHASPRAPEPEAQPEPEAAEEEEEEEDGEWAEALYDYSSGDAGDLQLQANQRVKVVEKTSDDWWTGEVEGQRGLFPASYVKLL